MPIDPIQVRVLSRPVRLMDMEAPLLELRLPKAAVIPFPDVIYCG
jgi:hypothetical protein